MYMCSLIEKEELKQTIDYGGISYEIIESGSLGNIYRPCIGSGPIIKSDVSPAEIEQTLNWIYFARDYSVGHAKEIQFHKEGRTVRALEMTDLKHLGFEMLCDRAKTHPLTFGEHTMLYLMLMHCVVLGSMFRFSDLGTHNCMCSGSGENFRIVLIDMETWVLRSVDYFNFIDNFKLVYKGFRLLKERDLLAVEDFASKTFGLVNRCFESQSAFIGELITSCVILSDQLLGQEEGSYYRGNIESLLSQIKNDSKSALYKCKQSCAVKNALRESDHYDFKPNKNYAMFKKG
jgi:hypothetical protein